MFRNIYEYFFLNKMMTKINFQDPRYVNDITKCHFYHVMDLPKIGIVGGEWDLRNSVDRYLGSIDLRDKSFLDLGCASGFISFEAEKKGAIVVAYDMLDATKDLEVVPYFDEYNKRESILKEAEEYISSIKNAFWFSREKLKSRVKVVYGNIYEADKHLPKFDFVMLGQILVHLKDPIKALEVASRLAKEKIIIVEAVLEEDQPYALFMPDMENRARFSWWRFSISTYKRILALLGFQIVQAECSEYMCLAGESPKSEKLCTIVAERIIVNHHSQSE